MPMCDARDPQLTRRYSPWTQKMEAEILQVGNSTSMKGPKLETMSNRISGKYKDHVLPGITVTPRGSILTPVRLKEIY
jgi:hypothetical protein